ncbi:MAG: hypothetical protein CMF50_09075 [Legionellales bacterium]|nr:hypothetical protein [Legionellales bacterium]|tara:strand:+ start:3942 stop:6839 length:2898 start_codon:yes stop_codon:yes gene_type:complete
MKKATIIAVCAFLLTSLAYVDALAQVRTQETSEAIKQQISESTSQVPASQTKLSGQVSKIIAIPYDKEVYTLSYNVFLASNNINDAFVVAQSAVQQRPNDLVWRERLATVARWNNKPRVALKQLLFLAETTKEEKIITEVITISKQLNDDDTLIRAYNIQLAKDPKNLQIWQELIAAFERLGEPEVALKRLQDINQSHPNKLYLELIANLYQAMGKPLDELKTLQLITKQYGMDPNIALREASIYSNRGEAQKAYAVLTEAKSQVKPDNKEYWRVYSNVSWTNQEKQSAALASENLHQAGEATEDDYYRLIETTRETDQAKAYAMAMKGWKQYKDISFYLYMMSIGLDLQKYQELYDLHNKLSPEDKAKLDNIPGFWADMANILQNLDQPKLAREAYHKALKLDNDNPDLRAGYIWLLIAQDDKDDLKSTLLKWQKRLPREPELYDPYASALLLLDMPDQALGIFRFQLDNKKDDYSWLLNFATDLDSFDPYEAFIVRDYIWRRVQADLVGQAAEMTDIQLKAYARLAITMANADNAVNTTARYAMLENNLVASDILFDQTNLTRNQEFANYLYRFHLQNNINIPAEHQLGVPIQNSDREGMQQAVNKFGDVLPNRNLSEAHERLANPQLARYYGYEAIRENPNDGILYGEMVAAMLAGSNQVSATTRRQDYGPIRSWQQQAEARYFVEPQLVFMPYAEYQHHHIRQDNDIVNVPQDDWESGMFFQLLQPRGNLTVGVNKRVAMGSFSGVNLQKLYQWNDRISFQAALGYNQNANDSAQLFVAGTKDTARLEMIYDITPRDILISDVEYDLFHDQSRHYLGRSQQFTANYRHFFTLGRPDLAVRIFGSRRNYNNDGSLSTSTARLIPPGNIPTLDFIMPVSFTEIGIGGEIGDTVEQEYTDAWRPFLGYNIIYNSVTHLGYGSSLGLAGSVFGRDKLSLYFAESSGELGIDQFSRVIGATYIYYF